MATTRIQVRALSLKSVAPISTSCGKFDLSMSLDGAQPTTRMRIIRDNDNGGRFFAPLALNTKVTFTPVGRAGETLELAQPVRFAATPNVPWHAKTAAPMPAGFVLVDTDGDRMPDTYLPGTSNFIAGSGRPAKPGVVKIQFTEYGTYCHAGDGCQHCYTLCTGCQIP
ncbi:MAG TPA: hypothetical protein VH394_12740 [Thermoanaerobaculia bacterium]|nr:hypothetical protein [Thermoanaerobaculia bacterium]